MTHKWLVRSGPVSARRGFDRLFEDVWGNFLANEERAGRTLPAMNVWEADEKVYAELEVPGMKLEELEIQVKGDELTITGERQAEEKKEDVTYYRYERHNRSISGTIRLPIEVEVDNVEARLENGILTIVLPKAEKAKVRNIQIQAN